MRMTPKDSIDALRLMRQHQDVLMQDGDDAEVAESIQGTIAVFLARKRAGEIGEIEFLDWYENGDALGEEVAPDPTA